MSLCCRVESADLVQEQLVRNFERLQIPNLYTSQTKKGESVVNQSLSLGSATVSFFLPIIFVAARVCVVLVILTMTCAGNPMCVT